jgi:hypothetical protein
VAQVANEQPYILCFTPMTCHGWLDRPTKGDVILPMIGAGFVVTTVLRIAIEFLA